MNINNHTNALNTVYTALYGKPTIYGATIAGNLFMYQNTPELQKIKAEMDTLTMEHCETYYANDNPAYLEDLEIQIDALQLKINWFEYCNNTPTDRITYEEYLEGAARGL